jgi:hypothetical protein
MSGPKESLMRNNVCLLVAMCAVLAVSTAWAAESAAPRHHHHGRHVTRAAPAPTAERPVPAAESRPDMSHSLFEPYAHPGEGDDDGLSRDPDECMKGCIGGNPG